MHCSINRERYREKNCILNCTLREKLCWHKATFLLWTSVTNSANWCCSVTKHRTEPIRLGGQTALGNLSIRHATKNAASTIIYESYICNTIYADFVKKIWKVEQTILWCLNFRSRLYSSSIGLVVPPQQSSNNQGNWKIRVRKVGWLAYISWSIMMVHLLGFNLSLEAQRLMILPLRSEDLCCWSAVVSWSCVPLTE